MNPVLIVALIVVSACVLSFLFGRVITPWRKRRLAGRFGRIRDGKAVPQKFGTSVVFDSFGCSFCIDKTGESSPRLLWKDVAKVSAYKRDMFTTDLICLFLSRADENGFEIHEEMNNWQEFIKVLPENLPGCLPVESWHDKVAFPAFEPNRMELFLRAGKSNSGDGKT